MNPERVLSFIIPAIIITLGTVMYHKLHKLSKLSEDSIAYPHWEPDIVAKISWLILIPTVPMPVITLILALLGKYSYEVVIFNLLTASPGFFAYCITTVFVRYTRQVLDPSYTRK